MGLKMRRRRLKVCAPVLRGVFNRSHLLDSGLWVQSPEDAKTMIDSVSRYRMREGRYVM